MNTIPTQAAGPTMPAVHPRLRAMLEAPIAPMLARMGWSNMLMMLAQSSTGLIETWFLAKLGTQVLAGIAQYYVPEDLVGRKVVVVVNLAPRKMRGQESNGMIVAASVGPEGRPVLATFTEDVPAGAKLK